MVTQLPRRAAGSVTLTRFRRRDLPGVLAIERAVYPRPWSPSLFATEIAKRPDRCYLVARMPRLPTTRIGGLLAALGWSRHTVVGYGGIMVRAGEAHVTTVAVDPAWQRGKVATRLLLALLREAITMEAEAATLEVRVANQGAQALYRQFGFAPVGVRPNYYAETGEDALIMWAHGLQTPTYAAVLAAQEARLETPPGASGTGELPVQSAQPPTGGIS